MASVAKGFGRSGRATAPRLRDDHGPSNVALLHLAANNQGNQAPIRRRADE